MRGDEEVSRPARLVVHHAAEWERPAFEKAFAPGEEVEAIAVGRGFVAAATSRRFLHVVTPTGLPIGFVSVPGPLVLLAASETLLLVVFHATAPAGKDQCLDYWLLAAEARERLSAGRLPLSPGATLRWAGFSAEALPLTLDSAGAVRGLSRGTGAFAGPRGAGGSWVPLLDLAAAAPEGRSLWPVRAESGESHCADVPRGEEPEAGPNHRLVPVRFRLPLGGRADGAEEAMLRERLLAGHFACALVEGQIPVHRRQAAEEAAKQRTKAGARCALRLFSDFTETGEVEKALDVAACFTAYGEHSSMLIRYATEAANKKGHSDLADRISGLAVKRPAEAEADGAPPAQAPRSSIE